MKILFVVPYVPSRIRIRPYELIRWLGRQGHAVTVVTQISHPEEQAELDELRSHCEKLVVVEIPRWRSMCNAALALPAKLPLQSVYSWNPLLAQKLAELVEGKNSHPRFDVAHVEHLRGVRFGLFLKQKANLPIVWDSVDCISYLFRQSAKSNPKLLSRLLNRFDLPRTVTYEREVVHKFSRVLVTSVIDRQAFIDLQPHGGPLPRIDVIPQGVDQEYFQPVNLEREPETIVLSGKMSYHANVRMVLHLVEEIMPKVWEQRPQVNVWVVGKDPSSKILKLTRDKRIIVTGAVGDLRPYLQKASVAVAPVCYGAGIQNKVLEAMACATPVIASPAAVSALQVKAGVDVMIASNPEEFSNMILKILQDPIQANRIGQAGLEYVQKNHQWMEIVNRLENIYTEVIIEEGTANHEN
jgi:sugar transferase (PEP-CTERM/EpsH1 system associated)